MFEWEWSIDRVIMTSKTKAVRENCLSARPVSNLHGEMLPKNCLTHGVANTFM